MFEVRMSPNCFVIYIIQLIIILPVGHGILKISALSVSPGLSHSPNPGFQVPTKLCHFESPRGLSHLFTPLWASSRPLLNYAHRPRPFSLSLCPLYPLSVLSLSPAKSDIPIWPNGPPPIFTPSALFARR